LVILVLALCKAVVIHDFAFKETEVGNKDKVIITYVVHREFEIRSYVLTE
jgi:hypothetical protein